MLGAAWVYNGPGPGAAAGDKTTVVLRKGASLPEIASPSSGRRDPLLVDLHDRRQGHRRGAQPEGRRIRIPRRASMAAVLDAIRHGRIVRHWITIPEGLTSDMVMDILNASPTC
jgi:UPF0755 protein